MMKDLLLVTPSETRGQGEW